MPREPFDWERDVGEAEDRIRASEHWYRQPDNTPLMAGQFWALWNQHMRDFQELEERVKANEERLIIEQTKRAIVDLLTTGTGRIFLVVVGVLVALALSRFGFDNLRIGWGGP